MEKKFIMHRVIFTDGIRFEDLNNRLEGLDSLDIIRLSQEGQADYMQSLCHMKVMNISSFKLGF